MVVKGLLSKNKALVYRMIAMAKKYRIRAYAPYSRYRVGAVVLASRGDNLYDARLFGGCNVENASYGMTICAERTAIFNAISAGYPHILAMIIATDNGGMSCGACRQVENEFNPNMTIISYNDVTGRVNEWSLNEQLPNAFGPASLLR
jgi:cytidine deaminase